jgi:hypothetical protein
MPAALELGPSIVMTGLVPAIHVFVVERLQDVDARNECGYDESEVVAVGMSRSEDDGLPGQARQ